MILDLEFKTKLKQVLTLKSFQVNSKVIFVSTYHQFNLTSILFHDISQILSSYVQFFISVLVILKFFKHFQSRIFHLLSLPPKSKPNNSKIHPCIFKKKIQFFHLNHAFLVLLPPKIRNFKTQVLHWLKLRIYTY